MGEFLRGEAAVVDGPAVAAEMLRVHHGGDDGADAGIGEDGVEDDFGEQGGVARIELGAEFGGDVGCGVEGCDAAAAFRHAGGASEGVVGDEEEAGVVGLAEEGEALRVAGELRAGEHGRAAGEGGGDGLFRAGDAGHADLAGGDEAGERFEEIVLIEDGGRRVVDEEEVDVIGFEFAEAGVEAGAEAVDGELAGGKEIACLALGCFAQAGEQADDAACERLDGLLPTGGCGQDAELGAEDGAVAAGAEEVAEEGLGGSIAVGAGGVEEVDAGVECGGEGGFGFAPARPAHHSGAAEAEDGD